MNLELTTHRRIADALTSTEPLASDTCDELIKDAAARAQNIVQRLEAIKRPGKYGGSPGPERNRVLTTGTVKELTALDEELATLETEADQLNAQRSELSRRRCEALGREAVEGMPDRYKCLSRALREAEKAREAYATALREVDAVLQQIEQSRHDANRAGRPVPNAPAKVYIEIDALAPGSDLTSVFLFGRHADARLETILGIARSARSSAA